MKRNLSKGEGYKVIYTYRTNVLQNGHIKGTVFFNSGYYIIHIIPTNQKFNRIFNYCHK